MASIQFNVAVGESRETFGSTLRRLRQGAGLTQERLAERSRLSVNAISTLERGQRRHPYPHTVQTLATALGLTAEQRDTLETLARDGCRGGSADDPPTGQDARLPVPRQLPAMVANFTGRVGDLADLDDLLADHRAGRSVPVSTISGTAGVGKTALAVMWAYRNQDRFPDGQLYVNLRGYDVGEPAKPAEVLENFLRALDVPVDRIPPGLEERSALFRSVADGRRMLVLLDNAGSAEQVRPLLPGPASTVIVTSRSSLTGLAVTAGAVRVNLDLLSSQEAVTLLSTIVGERRAAVEPQALRALARLCARLPLALQLGGQRAAGHPQLALADLVAELVDESERLEVLSQGADEMTAVRAVFSWSYRDLTQPQARLFRLLGLHPGPDIGTEAAAALAGLAPASARRLLRDLVDAHLVEVSGPGRVRMHDLLRAYARELAGAEDVSACVSRLVGFYLHATAAADHRLHPGRGRTVVDGVPAPQHAVAFADYEQAMRWCEQELANLVAVVRLAVDGGLLAAAWQLPNNLWSYLYLSKHWTEWLETHRLGLAAAEALGDRAGMARIVNGLATAERRHQPLEKIIEMYRRAMLLFQEVGDRLGEGGTRVNLGDACNHLQRYEESIEHGRAALEIFRGLGNEYAEAAALCNTGEAYLALRRFDDAVACLHDVLDLCRRIGHRSGEGMTLVHLGDGYLGLSRPDEAVDHLTRGLALCRDNGDRHGQALALDHLGRAHRRAGRGPAARDCWQQAVELLDGLDDVRAGEVRERLRRLDDSAFDAARAAPAAVPAAEIRDRPTSVALTASERRIAGLAAAGLTNREVAAREFISPKTVEVNLTRIYRKLGVRNRTELARVVPAEPVPEPAPETVPRS